MKVSLIQIEAIPGDIGKNIEKHLDYIDRAATLGPDLIAFPELSLSGYEPKLASAMAVDESDPRLEVFQDRSKQLGTIIAPGLPLRSPKGIYIGMLIFHPDGSRQVYRKQMLHEDEKPFFIAGREHLTIEIKGLKVAPAICYEAFQEEHFKSCLESGAEFYLVTVSKHFEGIWDAYKFIRKNAKKQNLSVAIVNSVGLCDNFLSAGGTSAWSEDGQLLQQLGPSEEGVLIYDYKIHRKDSDLSVYI